MPIHADDLTLPHELVLLRIRTKAAIHRYSFDLPVLNAGGGNKSVRVIDPLAGSVLTRGSNAHTKSQTA